MTRTQWLDYIRPGAISNILCVILAVVLWGDFVHFGQEVPLGSDSYAFTYVAEWLANYPIASKVLDLVLILSVAFVILRLNEVHSFIRVRTILPSVFCILFSGLLLQPHYLTSGSVVALLLFVCISSALTLTDDNSQMHTFNIGFLLGLSAIIYPFSLLYVVVFFYFYYNFNMLSLRTILATLTGVFVPLCYGSVGMWLYGKENIFANYLNPTTHLQLWLPKLDNSQITFVVIFCAVLIGSLVYVWMTYQKESLRPRRKFTFFVQLMLFTLALMLFSRSGFSNLLYTFIILSSIIIGRVYSTTVFESKISLWSFRILVVASVIYGLYLLV